MTVLRRQPAEFSAVTRCLAIAPLMSPASCEDEALPCSLQDVCQPIIVMPLSSMAGAMHCSARSQIPHACAGLLPGAQATNACIFELVCLMCPTNCRP